MPLQSAGPGDGAFSSSDFSHANKAVPACYHCGEPCLSTRVTEGGKEFCCNGCRTVHDLLAENGLTHYYALNEHPGVRIRRVTTGEKFAYLDEPGVRRQLLDFCDEKVARITWHVPAIHCVACIWLLENLFRLHPAVGKSQVNFPRREVRIDFDPQRISLGGLAALLAGMGYEPQLTLGTLNKAAPNSWRKKIWLQLGLAGFAFGNIMLFALPAYLGLDSLSGPLFFKVFGYLSLVLALPVLLYSASDYWRATWSSFTQRRLTLDVPIAIGLAALYVRSAYEILSGTGEGYLDSFAGLVFLLLCGRAFQQITHERIAFDRDYKCFFPLSVTRVRAAGEETVAISKLEVGDRLRLRNGELIPADCTLMRGDGLVDYSFVTGEAVPVPRVAGDYLYAGGRQAGQAIEVETVKPVSQSYLTSLWDHEVFRADREDTFDTMANRFARYFTPIVILIAVMAGGAWLFAGDPARAQKAFISVLIVACPCALALSAPFAFGTAQRLLARAEIFLRNTLVFERLRRIDTLAFDKTGTLTGNHGSGADFHPSAAWPHGLSPVEAARIAALARHSTHPHALRISTALDREREDVTVQDFAEFPGCGLAGRAGELPVRLGSAAWLRVAEEAQAARDLPEGSRVHVEIAGRYRGAFALGNTLRPNVDNLLERLGGAYELALVSGDNERERERFRALFQPGARLRFNLSPRDKLAFVAELQRSGRKVMMVGDGLNDAGAFQQSDVAVAVVEKIGAFSPASDVILPAAKVARLGALLRYSRSMASVVRGCFVVSAMYNVIGIGIASAGYLSPLVSAVLMPVSSVSVVLLACGGARRAARRHGISD